ncbi:hypothetical protein TraAM80_05110 [Trypanosoma rangeli]|uniref:Uncharacterized protein n=1 Tax=Trypanosoma rangeli TaxID=5698 RepID=A0A3R7KDT1_TRYRA|nr:uncharacterized protein TraAM80_05110 [Trypanosoma rangeli]RNF04518.1 hypothetical protein TraAM80_05110 [Trypanosoma rangeli]|eukprot:RNF04518.1 hypothetical protein TraAM80_05110 [Trypanosoma rangeli]
MRLSGARRASRGSVKHSPSIPYSGSSPFLANVEKRKGIRSFKAVDLVSRAASAVLQKIIPGPPTPPKYGDILREVPYHIQNRVVAFFSIHPCFCEHVFGVGHEQCIRFTRGPWMNEIAVVVGVRGGILWILGSDSTEVARPLYDIEQHGWNNVDPDSALLSRLREGIAEAWKDVELDYNPEQREFLQRAPDLYAEVVDDEDGGEELDFSELGWDKARTGSAAGNDGADHDEGKPSPDPPNNVRGEKANSSIKNGGLSTARRRIILVPQLLQVTDDIGWAGEGVVTVNGGGVKSFCASLSASVLL